MSFSWICLRLLLYSFSSSESSRFSASDILSCFSFFAFLTASLLLIIVSMSLFKLRKPSMLSRAFIASGFAIRRARVSLSTFTRSALSQRFARSVALVPLIAISKISVALICFIVEPSKASTGKNEINSSTSFCGLSFSGSVFRLRL